MTKTRESKTNRTPERPDKRIPVSGSRQILTVENLDPAFNYRWVNDIDGRIHRFIKGGYTHVTDDVHVGERKVDSSNGTSSVVSKDVGGGVTAYFMRIKREFYEEDKAAKARKINESEDSMKRQLNSKDDAGYGSVTFKR